MFVKQNFDTLLGIYNIDTRKVKLKLKSRILAALDNSRLNDSLSNFIDNNEAKSYFEDKFLSLEDMLHFLSLTDVRFPVCTMDFIQLISDELPRKIYSYYPWDKNNYKCLIKVFNPEKLDFLIKIWHETQYLIFEEQEEQIQNALCHIARVNDVFTKLRRCGLKHVGQGMFEVIYEKTFNNYLLFNLEKFLMIITDTELA